jgi:hypothetical protein
LNTLDLAYPGIAHQSRLREHLGIPGDGPWPVVLAGYVLHALNRTKEDVRRRPYSPSRNDATFP